MIFPVGIFEIVYRCYRVNGHFPSQLSQTVTINGNCLSGEWYETGPTGRGFEKMSRAKKFERLRK